MDSHNNSIWLTKPAGSCLILAGGFEVVAQRAPLLHDAGNHALQAALAKHFEHSFHLLYAHIQALCVQEHQHCLEGSWTQGWVVQMHHPSAVGLVRLHNTHTCVSFLPL